MDGIVQTIENAAANVDGSTVAEKVADNGVVAATEANGEPVAVDAELPEAKRFKEDTTPASTTTTAPATKEEAVPDANAAVPEVVTDAAETMEVDGEKKEDVPVATEKKEETVPEPAASTTTTTTIPDTTTAVTEEPAKEETPTAAAAEPEPVAEAVVAESTNEVSSSAAAVEEKMDTTEEAVKVEEVTTVKETPAVETPVAEESVIELDSTVDTTVEPKVNADEKSNEEATQEVVAVVEEKTEIPASTTTEENLATDTPSVTVDAPSEMEVTMEEPDTADKTLETPNVSMQPQMLANNRISELVLSNGSSTPNTSNPTSVEFQATPIKKAPIEESLPSTDEKSTEESSIQEHDSKSSSDDGGIKRLQETLKAVNGTTTTTDCSSAGEVEVEKHLDLTEESSVSLNPEDQIYETVVNFQNGLLQCLYVERVTRSAAAIAQLSHHSGGSDAASEKSASNGSATSLGPFTLPNTLTNTASGLSVSSQGSITGEKGRIQGVSALRNFLQDLLKKLPEEKKKPTGRPSKGRASSSSAPAASSTSAAPAAKETPSTPTRSTAAATTASPKAQAPETTTKKQVAFAATTESQSQVGNFVMARWSDRKYYAGRVTAEKPGQKFQVHFEDGAQRTLTRDQLVFGDKSVAHCLLNRVCNVLVEANIYETGLVVEIDVDACTYKVVTDSVTVTVPATDIYLDEDQAKACRDGDEGQSTAAGENTTTAAAAATTPSTTTSGRRKRTSDVAKSSPEAGPSTAGVPAAKKSRKR